MKTVQTYKKRIALLALSCVVGLGGLVAAYKSVVARQPALDTQTDSAKREGAAQDAVATAECAQTEEDDYLFVGCNGFF